MPAERLPSQCFCIGPQDGEPECPCRMRAKSDEKAEAFRDGFEAGRRFAQSEITILGGRGE